MNALLYREYLALARLAARLGRPGEQAGFAAKAAALRHAVNQHLWDAQAESSLMNHGFRDEAAELVRRLTKLYLMDIVFCGSLHENYCAETGQPLAPSAAQSKHGQEGGFLGWNLLLQDMTEMLDGRPNLLEL